MNVAQHLKSPRSLLLVLMAVASSLSYGAAVPPVGTPAPPAPVPTTVTTTTAVGTTTTAAPADSTQTTTTTTAAGTQTTTQPASDTPSTGLDIGTGDIVFLRVDTPGFVSVDDSTKKYCAPAGTELQVSNTTDDGGKKFYVRVLRLAPTQPSSGFLGIRTTEGHATCTADVSTDLTVSEHVQYLLDKKVLDSHEYGAAGLEYGILIAPYKFHISDRSLTGSATVGPYIGFHALTSPGSTLSEVISIGIGNVPVTKESSPPGDPSTSDKVSLSVATGYVLTLTKSGRFQLAFLIGFDWAGHESEYKYEGKPWFGVGFGANLTK
jgi:hypothetical protein